MISLDEFKEYLNIDLDYKNDDRLLINLLNIAESTVLAYINGGCKDASIIEGTCDSLIDNYDSRLNAMILMIGSELYSNREMQTNSNLKQSPVFDMIATPLTKFNSFG